MNKGINDTTITIIKAIQLRNGDIAILFKHGDKYKISIDTEHAGGYIIDNPISNE